MAKAPYPGYPPSYEAVDIYGGRKRQCWVLELCTDEGLDGVRMAQLEDEIAILLENKFPEIKHSQIVRSDRFDTLLRQALRTK